MKQDEEWVRKYLVGIGYPPDEIQFEPDGNTPPDFLVSGRIAIEVRRLDQHVEVSGQIEPIGNTAHPFENRLERLFKSIGGPTSGVSWVVLVDFKRPLPRVKEWEAFLRQRLELIHAGNSDREERTVIQIGDNLRLELLRMPPDEDAFFLGSISDDDEGGYVEVLEKSLLVCVREKEQKVAKVRTKYPEWWLILVDHIWAGKPEDVALAHTFDKVIVIHPDVPDQAYEIPSN